MVVRRAVHLPRRQHRYDVRMLVRRELDPWLERSTFTPAIRSGGKPSPATFRRSVSSREEDVRYARPPPALVRSTVYPISVFGLVAKRHRNGDADDGR